MARNYSLKQNARAREAVHIEADNLTFGLFSKSEVKSLSTVNITNTVSFNQLGHPLTNGLYDLRMGPYTERDNTVCLTCHLNAEHCPGHLGHIELPMPVVNSLFYTTILRLLKITCIHCHKFKMADCFKTCYLVQQKLLNAGLVNAAQQAGDIVERKEDRQERGSKKKTDQGEEMALDAKLQDFAAFHLAQAEAEAEMSTNLNNENTRSIESLRKQYTKVLMTRGKEGTCPRCGAITSKITFYKSRFIYEGLKMDEEDEDLTGLGARKRSKVGEREKSELNPQELKDHFRILFSNDHDLLKYLFPVFQRSDLENPTDVLFMEVIPVPPPRTRPVQFTGGIMTQHPQSQSLLAVIEAVTTMKQLVSIIQGADVTKMSSDTQDMIKTLRGDTTAQQLDLNWKELQNHVDHVVDREMNASRDSKNVGWGFKQLIERKQGLFRMHMMGKRVNYAARTVITPDPNINIDEIGLPEVFAKKLTYQVPVTPWNVTELRDMVMNGPDVHPGAIMVENEHGQRTFLDANDRTQREAIAKTLLTPSMGLADDPKPKIVFRHLKNGDAMLLNRQPSLHKPSILSHRARVLKGEKVMRLHYANCKHYNADFDGDEMNAHFPQSEMARAEAYTIVNSAWQYLVPKDGTPLHALIQDHVISGVKMGIRGRFFERGEYQQLVYGGLLDLPGRIKLLPPAILKPKQLWSGKQILSTIIINLVPKGKPAPNLISSAKIKSKEWLSVPPRAPRSRGKPEKNPDSMTESEVVIRGGEVCVGILDKNQYGATPYSLVHLFFELYGGIVSGKLLSSLSILFTNFLRTEGFTLGVEDILVTPEADQARLDIMAATKQTGNKSASTGVGVKGEIAIEELYERLEAAHRASVNIPKKRVDIDRAYKGALNPATNDINKCCLPTGLIKKFPHNNLQLMVQSGAKGSTVNTMQISCLLGQIELEGKRPPIMISGKSLPSFRPYDTTPKAGGFIDGRFMTGIQPQDFFFHCMAGREGLIDTACKTSRSGYLQRCLIKLLEGLVVNYDMTVRDSDGSVIQFQYGEDSLEIGKYQYLKKGKLGFLSDNIDCVLNEGDIKRSKSVTDHEAVRKAKKSIRKWNKSNKAGERRGAFLSFSKSVPVDVEGYDVKRSGGNEGGFLHSRAKSSCILLDTWNKLDKSAKKDFVKKSLPCPAPLASILPSNSHFGSLTEKMEARIEEFAAKDHGKKFDKEKFREMMYLKNQLACVPAGEPVGILAAQSIGEPSTQMTLNTFHFAGRGEMNVTLGIPRLREILMVAAANLKTPSMDIPFKPETSNKDMEKLRLDLNRALISDLLENVCVTERVELTGSRRRTVNMRFNFLPYKKYKNQFGVKPAKVLQYFETRFIMKVLMPVLAAVTKEKKILVETATEKDRSRNPSGESEEGGEGEKEKERDDAAGRGMGDADSSDDEGEGEGGSDEVRARGAGGDQEYEEQEEEEKDMVREIGRELDGDDELEDDPKPFAAVAENDEGFEEYVEEEVKLTEKELQEVAMSSEEASRRRNDVIRLLDGRGGVCSIVEYSFDTVEQSWCELTLSFDITRKRVDMTNVIRKAAEKGVVHEVKNLKRAFVLEEKGEMILKTDGINIDAMFKYVKILDINRLSCNNIHDMARYYGIESANRTIVREIVNVFDVYGIEVDPHHLSLISDYMTFDGTYKPFNRIGIENNPSPIQQMTFETAMGFLRSATLGGKSDNLSSPSSCLVLGKPCFGGTGSFKLVQKL